MSRITVDFNATTKDGERVIINMIYHSELRDVVKPGMRVILYEENDIEVEAVVETEVDEKGHVWWYGRADWSTLKDLF